MAKKTIDSKVWQDNFFSDLTAKQKLFWIYLLTNDANNMLGIYELNIRRASFDCDLSRDEVQDYLNLFVDSGKIEVKRDYVILNNFLKYQNYNNNMKTSALNVYKDLPNEVKLEGYDYFESFEEMTNAFGHVAVKTKKPNTKDKLFNEFWVVYDKPVKRDEAFDEWKLLSEEEKKIAIKTAKKYADGFKNGRNDPKFKKLAVNWLKDGLFLVGQSTLKDYDKAVEILKEYDVVGNKQTYKGQDYDYPENVNYAKEIKELERQVRENWSMSVKELYNKVNE